MSDLPAIAPDSTASPELTRIGSMLGVIAAVLAVASLTLARDVLIPITLSILLSFLLAPLARLLRRLHLGRTMSSVAAVLVGLGLMLALGWLIGAQIAGLAGRLPRYQATVEAKLDSAREVVVGEIGAISRRLGLPQAPSTPAAPASAPAGAPVIQAPAAPKAAPATVQPAPAAAAMVSPQLGEAFRLAKAVMLPVASPLGTAGIVFGVAIFILLQREDLRDRLTRVFGAEDPHRATVALDELGERLSQYYIALLGVNAAFGIAIALGLWAIGVPSPVLWGTLAMLMRFVPYIGTPLAALLPIALAIAVAPGWGMALFTVALFGGLELLTSQAIEPFLYGNRTGLSPFAVVVAAVFWTWAWGPIGLLPSTPLTVCLVVLGRTVKPLEFLDVLLGNRPPLSAAEFFYQRLLAGDPDELEDHAEGLLRDVTLSVYYGEVAIPGLQRATADAARGVLRPERLARMGAAVAALVRELDAHPEAAPPAEMEAGPVVLCVAGRGPLDATATAMTAQLLRGAGLQPRVLAHAAVSRGQAEALEGAGIGVVALCYLDPAVPVAHLRFVLRRLRQRLPGRPIVFGLAGPMDATPAGVTPAGVTRRGAVPGGTTIEADRVCADLPALVEACRALAAAASPAAIRAAE